MKEKTPTPEQLTEFPEVPGDFMGHTCKPD
jgi:hypothetical protein